MVKSIISFRVLSRTALVLAYFCAGILIGLPS